MTNNDITNDTTLRQELACALRWTARLDMHEGVANHFSVAVDERRFLMNPAGAHFSTIRASDLLLLDAHHDADKEASSGGGRDGGSGKEGGIAGADETAWCLHGYFHRHLPRARCLMHAHSTYATALASLADWRMTSVDQNACRFHNRIAYDDNFGGMLLAEEEAARQCRVIGNKPVLLMRGHGVLVVAETVALAFDLLYYFERSCRNQWLAIQAATNERELFAISDDIAEKTAQQWEAYPARQFAALQKILDDEEPDYKN